MKYHNMTLEEIIHELTLGNDDQRYLARLLEEQIEIKQEKQENEERWEGTARKFDLLIEFAGYAVQNAEVIPDPRMDGLTDCYAVPLDDIETLQSILEEIEV